MRLNASEKEIADRARKSGEMLLVLRSGQERMTARRMAARGLGYAYGKLFLAKQTLLDIREKEIHAALAAGREVLAGLPADNCETRKKLIAERKVEKLARARGVRDDDPTTWNNDIKNARPGKRWDVVDRLLSDEEITEDQWRAATTIAQAANIITRGVGYRIMSFDEYVDGTDPDAKERIEDWEKWVLERYSRYREEAKRQRIVHGAVRALVVDCKSLSAVDSEYKKRRGWAKEQLCQALDIFVKINDPRNNRG